MSVFVKGGDFVPAPEGLWDAVCVDVADLGLKETQWGVKQKIKIVWEIAAEMQDGRRFVVSSRFGTTAACWDGLQVSQRHRQYKALPVAMHHGHRPQHQWHIVGCSPKSQRTRLDFASPALDSRKRIA